MRPKYEQLKADINHELNQIDTVVAKIREIKGDETEISRTAIAAYLMNFYNGIENILKLCAKEYYKNMPKGEDWHKKLLLRACSSNREKIPIFNIETADKLNNYLLFRHLFIHGYSFKLNWDKMKALVDDIGGLWSEVNGQIREFMLKI